MRSVRSFLWLFLLYPLFPWAFNASSFVLSSSIVRITGLLILCRCVYKYIINKGALFLPTYIDDTVIEAFEEGPQVVMG